MGESVNIKTEESLAMPAPKELQNIDVQLAEANAEILSLKKQLLSCQRLYLQLQTELWKFQSDKLDQLEQILKNKI
jgi:predicted  nucleic acid-binding Zn-ribbon protein